MTEEVKQDQIKDEADKSAENAAATAKSTDSFEAAQEAIETRARDQGWVPQEEWEGDPADWRDARTFIDRGELLNKISQTNKENKELRKAFKMLQEHNAKLAQKSQEYNTLKEQRKELLKEGETEKALELEDKLEAKRDEVAEAKAAVQRQELALETQESAHPEFQSWVDRNSWYAQNAEMREFADSIGTSYTRSSGIRDPHTVLKYVEQRVRKAYPEKFTNPNREKPSAVDGGTGRRSAGISKAADKYELSEVEEKVFRTLQAQDAKFWTREKYIADLKGAK